MKPPKALAAGLLRVLLVVLVALAALHLGWGFFQLVGGPPPNAAIDLRYRWLEGAYFAQRQNPLDIVLASAGLPTDAGVHATIDPALGPLAIDTPAYPPWSYVTGLALAPLVPFQAARMWMALLDIASLAIVAAFAWRHFLGAGPVAAALGAALVLAPVSNLFTLSAGQYGLVVNALLLATMQLDGADRWIWGGVCFALGLVKPQTAGLFALVLLVRGSWKLLAVAAAIIVAETAFALAWIRSGTIEFGGRLFHAARLMYDHGYGPLSFVLKAGGDGARWVPLFAGAGVFLALLLLAQCRRAPLLARLSIVAVVGRFWTYHGIYDNVMLVFLPLALLEIVLRCDDVEWVPFAALAAVCAALYLPLPWGWHDSLRPLQVAHLVAWIAGLAVVATHPQKEEGR